MQVTRLSRRLFDALQPLHRLGHADRFILECAALLHDIGWAHGRRRHHKNSRDMILKDKSIPLAGRERLLIALIARYHRRSEPTASHRHYRELERHDRRLVRQLSALLRMADGLDNEHRLAIRNLAAEITPHEITLHCGGNFDSPGGLRSARAKALLLEKVFERRVVFTFPTKH
ncbi:MAG: HD domain-containing protein [Lentisphaerae bacterium]|nr:HD domain-containing protein [Lentisphaerota bacterium]